MACAGADRQGAMGGRQGHAMAEEQLSRIVVKVAFSYLAKDS